MAANTLTLAFCVWWQTVETIIYLNYALPSRHAGMWMPTIGRICLILFNYYRAMLDMEELNLKSNKKWLWYFSVLAWWYLILSITAFWHTSCYNGSIVDRLFLQSWRMCQKSWFISFGSSFQYWGTSYPHIPLFITLLIAIFFLSKNSLKQFFSLSV